MSTPPTSFPKMDNAYWLERFRPLRDCNPRENGEQDALPYGNGEQDALLYGNEEQGVLLYENGEQDTLLWEKMQTEQREQNPGSSDESPEDETLRGPRIPLPSSQPSSQPSPTPSPPSAQPAFLLPVPAPDIGPSAVVTEGIKPQAMAPSPALAANDAPESVIPGPVKASRPKQSRASPGRVTKRAAKPPKRLSANKLQKEMDKEGMAHLAWRNQRIYAERAAAQPVYGAPGQLYGQNQFGQIHDQNVFQVTPGFSPLAPGPYPQPPGFNPPAQGSYYQAAGPFPQQTPSLPPLAPHIAPPPAVPPAPYIDPALAYSHGYGYGHPPLPPRLTMDMWPANPPQPFVMQQPQNMYQQHQMGYSYM